MELKKITTFYRGRRPGLKLNSGNNTHFMNDRLNTMINKICGLLFITFLTILSYGNQSERRKDKTSLQLPNIVLIFADDRGYGDV